MSVHLFLISADATLGALAARAVTGLPIHLQTAQSQAQADAMLADDGRRSPLVMLIDLNRGDYQQMRQWVQRVAPWARVFFIAPPEAPGAGALPPVSAASRRGETAVQILAHPRDARQQAELFGRILSEATVLADIEGGISGLDDLVGRSVAFRTALESATAASRHEQPVLLLGEPGVGKRYFARAIHAESRRSQGAFVTLDCRALSYDALGSTLFAAGAAGVPAHALVREAVGGTLLLEAVEALDARYQASLAQFIDEMRLLQAQGADPQRGDPLRGVRLIAATQHETIHPSAGLSAELLQRLRGGEVRVPPLRERPSDILLMAEHFLSRAVPHAGGRSRYTLTDAAKQRLIAYGWPGNVRELIGVLQVASLNAEGSVQIDLRHLPDSLLAPAAERRPAPAAAEGDAARPVPPRSARISTVESGRATRFTCGPVVIELPEEGVAFDDLERAILRAAMARTRGNVVRAAKFLRLGRGSLRYRLEKHGIVQPKRRRPAKRRLHAGEASEAGEGLSRAS